MCSFPQVHIWTDGSATPNPGRGGWAAVLADPEKDHYRLLAGSKQRATNNEMEATALLEALSHLKKPCMVIVYSDSTYVESGLRAIAQGRMLESNKDVWEELATYYRRQIAVRYDHIMAHRDDTALLNQLCDSIAGKAARGRVKAMDRYLNLAELQELLLESKIS